MIATEQPEEIRVDQVAQPGQTRNTRKEQTGDEPWQRIPSTHWHSAGMKEAGFEPNQAEAMAEVMANQSGELATKAGLEAVEKSLH